MVVMLYRVLFVIMCVLHVTEPPVVAIEAAPHALDSPVVERDVPPRDHGQDQPGDLHTRVWVYLHIYIYIYIERERDIDIDIYIYIHTYIHIYIYIERER